jgi:hypothetical protein
MCLGKSFQIKDVNTNNLQKAGPCLPERPCLNGLDLGLGISYVMFHVKESILCVFETQIESIHHTNLISLINSMFVLFI